MSSLYLLQVHTVLRGDNDLVTFRYKHGNLARTAETGERDGCMLLSIELDEGGVDTLHRWPEVVTAGLPVPSAAEAFLSTGSHS